MATKALGKELKNMQAVQAKALGSGTLHELGWYVNFDEITNLFQWIVELHSFDPKLPLAQDMKKVGMTSLVLEMRFGKDYPMTPPFVRMIRPRFLPFIQGGGGHVTGGGAMCMELLTNDGWSPANSIESVLLQVRLALMNLEPKPARIQAVYDGSYKGGSVTSYSYRGGDYGVEEAITAFERAARTHGWTVPKDLRLTAEGR